MVGLPKNRQVFDKRSSECDVIKIERFLFEESADREIDDFLYGDAL